MVWDLVAGLASLAACWMVLWSGVCLHSVDSGRRGMDSRRRGMDSRRRGVDSGRQIDGGWTAVDSGRQTDGGWTAVDRQTGDRQQ